MKDTPINYEIVCKQIRESKITNIGKASIREVKLLINNIEKETGEKFVRMEMGVPGLTPPQIEAAKSGYRFFGLEEVVGLLSRAKDHEQPREVPQLRHL